MRPVILTRVAQAILLPLTLLAQANVGDLLRQAEERIQKEQFPAAEPLLEQALQTEPGNIEALYRLGYIQSRQRKITEAKRNFSQVVQAAPRAHYSRYFLGRIALLENKPAEAISWLEPVLQSGQPVFDAASQLAEAYATTGQLEKAIGALRTAATQAPWDGALYYRLGQLYSKTRQAELAKEALETSRRLKNADREDVETLMNAAQAITTGNTADGLRFGARILDRKDADPNALLALGVVFGNGNLQSEALRAFTLAAARDPRMFQAQFNQGLALLKLNRTAEALAPLARAVELLPQSLEANMTYGLASVMSQKYVEAVAPLERAWKGDSTNPRVGALLATAYLRSGAPAKAAALLQQPLLRDSDNLPALLLLIEALNANQDQAGALEAAQRAQKRFPRNAQAHLALAQQLARLGRYQESRPAFEEALRLMPGLPEAELGVADSLQKAGDHAAALGHYRNALRAGSTALAARAGLSRSLVSLRQLEEARQVLEEGLPLHPSDVSLRIELARVYARLGKSELAAEQTKAVERLRAAQPVQ
jgi:tetratricopeptide (TPR) repeat protein